MIAARLLGVLLLVATVAGAPAYELTLEQLNVGGELLSTVVYGGKIADDTTVWSVDKMTFVPGEVFWPAVTKVMAENHLTNGFTIVTGHPMTDDDIRALWLHLVPLGHFYIVAAQNADGKVDQDEVRRWHVLQPDGAAPNHNPESPTP